MSYRMQSSSCGESRASGSLSDIYSRLVNGSEGYRRLLSSMPATVTKKTISAAIWFPVYDALKHDFGGALAGGIAGILASLALHPVDNVKVGSDHLHHHHHRHRHRQ